MRSYWQPAALVDEARRRAADPSRQTARREFGAVFATRPDATALIDRQLRASRRRSRLRGGSSMAACAAAFHGWLFDANRPVHRDGRPEPKDSKLCRNIRQRSYPRHREERHPLGLSWRRRAAGISRNSIASSPPATHIFAFQGPHGLQLAPGPRSRHRSRARLLSAPLSSRTRTHRRPMASSFRGGVRGLRPADDKNPARI